MSSELIAPVKDGVIDQYTSDVAKKTDNTGKGQLGKDAFLQLLVAQMRYQDPLSPSSDTEWIAQMASFSSLEQMQALNQTISNSQSFSLLGQQVVVKVSEESAKTIEGTVDFVTMKNGSAYLSIDGKLYDASLVLEVKDATYVLRQKAPTVAEVKEKYNHQEPKDIDIKIDMGKDDGMASSVVVVINGKAIKKENMSYDESKGVLTIKKEAFQRLDAGAYDIGFVFDDQLKTVITGKVSVTITGIKPDLPPEEEEGDGGDGDDDDTTT